jgi:hypothetical protein
MPLQTLHTGLEPEKPMIFFPAVLSDIPGAGEEPG